MTGGPWTRSMKVVHGPGPKWGSMDPWSMFCPHPVIVISQVNTEDQYTKTVILIDKITAIFHNLRGYICHFIMQVTGDITKNS